MKLLLIKLLFNLRFQLGELKRLSAFIEIKIALIFSFKRNLLDEKIKETFEKRPNILRKLGFEMLPDKRTIDRRKHKLDNELQQLVRLTGDKLACCQKLSIHLV